MQIKSSIVLLFTENVTLRDQKCFLDVKIGEIYMLY